jgi:hypothetical protein
MLRRAAALLLLAASVTATTARAQQGGVAAVHVEANEPGVRVVAETGRDAEREQTRFFHGRLYTFYGQQRHFRTICEAPCAVEMPTGEYSMALARDGALVPVEEPVVVPGPATLRATYESRHGLRVAGHVTLAIGVPAGIVLLAIGVTRTAPDCSTPNGSGGCAQSISPDPAWTIAGGALLLASIVVGSALSLQHDRATIEVVPSSPAMLLEHRTAMEAPPSEAGGLSLRVRF